MMKINTTKGTRHNSPQPKRSGATMVEFVVVVPFFFLLMFAGIEFSMLGTMRSTANNASYEAARVLVIPGADKQVGVDEATRIMGAIGVDTITVDVTPDTISADTETVTVEVTIPVAENAIFTPWFIGNANIVSECTLKTERYGGITIP